MDSDRLLSVLADHTLMWIVALPACYIARVLAVRFSGCPEVAEWLRDQVSQRIIVESVFELVRGALVWGQQAA
jgi:hypothetical protein